MICSEKTIKVVRDKNGNPTDEVEYFVSLHPNHYNIKVTKEAYHSVSVSEDYNVSFTEIY
jgi:hypothetical protein